MIKLIRTSSDNPDFIKLVALLDEDLAVRDGDDHAFYAQFNKTVHIHNVVLAYKNDEVVACGAFRDYEGNTVEIKRMFVQPQYRGKGIAGLVLQELERWAKQLSFHCCILETGKNQPEAIRLYHKSGYSRIPNYGQYQTIENSVYEKDDLRTGFLNKIRLPFETA
ncbi:MAG: GNAT family N-acetyltransferase [Chitinophagaceae bacterium]|nr:GNAT family N-acetyltransferase [Chitinophagaceae bacterium]